jgi:glutamine synthetase
LGWMGASNMVADANPLEKVKEIDGTNKQTVEFRAPDGSADLYHLVAGLIVASQHGLEMDNALEISEKLYIDVNIFDEKNKNRLEQLELLPVSCYESAECLTLFFDNYLFVANVCVDDKLIIKKFMSKKLFVQ